MSPGFAIPMAMQCDHAHRNERRELGRRTGARNGHKWVDAGAVVAPSPSSKSQYVTGESIAYEFLSVTRLPKAATRNRYRGTGTIDASSA